MEVATNLKLLQFSLLIRPASPSLQVVWSSRVEKMWSDSHS